MRGDFEPLVDEATFYRVQAILDGGVVVAGPRPRNHPDFPLRGFVRCDTCGRPLTGGGRRAAPAATTLTTTASGSAAR